jgi:D-alanyl-D-alanine dipeptidase
MDIVLIADPRVLAINIEENHDQMINLIKQNDIAYGPSPEIPNNYDYTKMRVSVYDMLKKAQALLPLGLSFCLYECYRSLALQKMLFDNRFTLIEQQYPHWSLEEIFNETTKLISPVTNLDGSTNVPPHSTGGAIDVYLLDDKGNAVDMGIHPKDWMEDDGSYSLTDSLMISDQARHYRNVMSNALSNVGFINYPTEYWHWSYGDRYWAYHTNEANAIFGSY